MKSYLKDIQSIRKDNIYNYCYKYWTGDENGMRLDVHMNNKYGQDRKGYEQYKNDSVVLPDGTLSEPGQIDVSYSGVTSLRTVTDRKTNKVIGYITETKLSDNPARDEAKIIFGKQLQAVMNHLEVHDVQSFMYYINQNMPQMDFRNSVDTYLNKVRYLLELVKDYNDDEEFREFIDKIKG